MRYILPITEWLQINEAYFTEGAPFSKLKETGLSIMTKLVDNYGFSPILAAALGGNMFSESKLDPTRVSADGYSGLIQWGGARLEKLKKLPNWKSIDTQLNFINSELKNNPYFIKTKPVISKIDALNVANLSVEEKAIAISKATDIVTLNYEGANPSNERRTSAKELYDLYMSLQIKSVKPEEKIEPVSKLTLKPIQPLNIN